MKGTDFINNIRVPATLLETNVNGARIDTSYIRNFNARGEWWDMYETAIFFDGRSVIVGQTNDDSDEAKNKIIGIHLEWVKRFATEGFDRLYKEIMSDDYN